jgi:hypothetical protein
VARRSLGTLIVLPTVLFRSRWSFTKIRLVFCLETLAYRLAGEVSFFDSHLIFPTCFLCWWVPILVSFSLIHRLLNDVQRLERPEAVLEGADVLRGQGTISCNSTRMILLGCK